MMIGTPWSILRTKNDVKVPINCHSLIVANIHEEYCGVQTSLALWKSCLVSLNLLGVSSSSGAKWLQASNISIFLMIAFHAHLYHSLQPNRVTSMTMSERKLRIWTWIELTFLRAFIAHKEQPCAQGSLGKSLLNICEILDVGGLRWVTTRVQDQRIDKSSNFVGRK